MRTRILGTVGALLAAAPLSLADPPPRAVPQSLSGNISATPLPAIGTPSVLPPTNEPSDSQQPSPPADQQPIAAPIQQQAQSDCNACQQPKTEFRDCHCGPREQIWFGGNYRTAWIKDAPMPYPLLTTGPATSGGFPGSPGTINLFGGEPINYGTFSGLDVNAGMWLDCRHTFGLEVGGFYLFQQEQVSAFASNGAGQPFLARPIFDGLRLAPSATLVSSPGTLTGNIAFRSSAHMAGGEANIVRNLVNCPDYTIDTYAGFRYIELDEDFDVLQSSTPIGGNTLFLGGAQLPAGVGLTISDSFNTRNQFYGGQLGSRGEMRFGPVFVSGFSSVALGPNHEVIGINGRTTGNGAGGSFPGGLLAVGGGVETLLAPNGTPTAFVRRGNQGQSVTNRFNFVPEVGIQVGVYLSCHVRVSIGYNFLYMSDVARPGTQIDTLINGKLVPASPSFGTQSGFPNPQITGRREDFNVQSLQFGMEMKF